MQPDNFSHWLEALGAAVVGLGAWLWRLARLDQHREDRLTRMEQWRQDHMAEYRAVASTLSLLQQGQAVQTEAMKNMCRSLDELRKDHRNFIAGSMAGGGRWNDPPRSDEQ